MCLCACVRFVRMRLCLWFDPDLPNGSKTWRTSTKRGSTFQDTWMDRDWQTISSSSGVLQPMDVCLCAYECTTNQRECSNKDTWALKLGFFLFIFLSHLCEFYIRKEVCRKNRHWTRKYSDDCAGAVLTQADSEFTSQPCFWLLGLFKLQHLTSNYFRGCIFFTSCWDETYQQQVTVARSFTLQCCRKKWAMRQRRLIHESVMSFNPSP